MGHQIFEHRHRVTYGECTVGNHVYYANYLAILEAARGEFFRALGLPFLQLQEQNQIFPVIECSVRYKQPARYDDWLAIRVHVNELKGVRLGFGYAVTNQDGKLILEADTRHVCATLAEKPQRLPAVLVEKLAPFVPETPVL